VRLVICLGGVLLLLILSPLLLVAQDDVLQADGIVVIGGDHKPERVKRAVELYQQGYAPLVIVSAGTIVQEGGELIPEADVMHRLALEMGLPDSVMVLETQSQSTLGNAYYSKQVCEVYGIESILLVTSAYHSRRARRIFFQTLGPEILVSAQPAPRGHHPLFWWLHPDQAYVVFYEYKN
jgi:uncharacterized SAM-binding protein YcdF (DUF218 family)